MEAIIALLFIIILIVVINQNSKLFQQLQKIENELKKLKNSFNSLPSSVEEKKEIPVVNAPSTTPAYESIFSVAENSEPAKEPIIEIEAEQATFATQPEQDVFPSENKPTENKTYVEPPKPVYKPSFFERHPDMEKFIGENLVNKIGIAILVLAIGFFVKYAIDQNWVGPVGRVSIGILCGAILVGIAHKMRNSYKSFSSVLAGGGLAVFYFTITLAYHQFKLFDQSTAFIIMIVITAFAVVLSLLYNKQELAIISLLGGFLAPFLVSSGNGNYKTLFIYLILLNVGLLIIAYNKAWRLLNFLCFFFTVVLFCGWLIFLDFNVGFDTYRNALLFASIFYLLFFAINIANNIKEKKKFIASDFGILLTNSALYFGIGVYCLQKMNAGEFKGLFSAAMGIFNLVATYFLFRKQKVDKNILYLLMGITLTFISVTAPLQLNGNNITLFWASEAVLLYWLFTKSQLRIIQISSVIIWALMLISLLMDWGKVYIDYSSALRIVANKGFITSFFAAIATYLLYIIRKNEIPVTNKLNLVPGKLFFRIAAIILLFISGALEINHQFEYYYPHTNINFLYLLLYCFSFCFILMTVSEKVKSVDIKPTVFVGILVSTVFLYMWSIAAVFSTQAAMLTGNINNVHFIAHWIGAILFLFLFYKLTKVLINDSWLKNFGVITWLLCFVIVLFFSVEIHFLVNAFFYSSSNTLYDIQRVYIKTGLPILWGICSFIFMSLGMRYKYRPLRIISLTLFTITLLKLFMFDIRNIPAGGKIAAFFCLGVILLIVSFMYQRLKKIIIDDENKTD